MLSNHWQNSQTQTRTTSPTERTTRKTPHRRRHQVLDVTYRPLTALCKAAVVQDRTARLGPAPGAVYLYTTHPPKFVLSRLAGSRTGVPMGVLECCVNIPGKTPDAPHQIKPLLEGTFSTVHRSSRGALVLCTVRAAWSSGWIGLSISL